MIHFDSSNFNGHRVIMRVDFNVPLNSNFEITDDTRIKGALRTIKKILIDGGSVVLMSHLGRPKGGPEEKYSLKHLLVYLRQLMPLQPVYFAEDCVSDLSFTQSSALQPGEILLLENLRFYSEEEKGDVEFAKKLSKHGDIYINDAFGTAHRAHASTATIAQYYDSDHKGFGYLMIEEIENANKVVKHAEAPVTAIVGGAKVSDKIKLLENLIDSTDNILIGGGMAYTFIAAKGGEIGKSLFEPDYTELALRILEKAKDKNTKIYLPEDSLTADIFNAEAIAYETKSDEIPDLKMGLDIGPIATEEYKNVILKSKTILWNGPMGVFEFPNFSKGTFAIAQAVAEATDNGAFSLIGGGDSVSAINKSGLEDRVSFVSTGGGAMLEYLEGKILPGIAAIEN